MKLRSFLSLIVVSISLFITSCGNSDDLLGNWKSLDVSQIETGVAQPRFGAVSFTIGNYAYVGTGVGIANSSTTGDKLNLLKDFFKIDLTNQTITNIAAEFPGDERQDAVAFTAGGKGYVGLGYNGKTQTYFNDFYEFDPTTETWTKLEGDSAFPGVGTRNGIGFGYGNKGFIGTGTIANDESTTLLNNIYWKYDTDTKKWTKIGAGGDKVTKAVSFVIDKYAYICLGENALGNNRRVFRFDCESETFVDRMKYLESKNGSENVPRLNAVSFVIGKKAYIATGTTGTGQTRDVWEFNPEKDDWIERASIPDRMTIRSSAIAFSNGSSGFIITGKATGPLLDLIELEPTKGIYDYDDYY
ncbi:MAG: hypothetical protein N4A49_01495 [Marinifilaceae bacterium]|jgi:N-acetylneuraminic acid mutarotase|nr:hypothetical protein [Marinifilaceae bacterium]